MVGLWWEMTVVAIEDKYKQGMEKLLFVTVPWYDKEMLTSLSAMASNALNKAHHLSWSCIAKKG